MKKILIISYYFPPCAKAGAHRAYSIAEFLPRFGWDPIFIAPENGYYGRVPRFDDALLDVVGKFPTYHIPFFYPFNNQSLSLLARGGRRFWEALLLPDGKVFWNRAIKKKLGQIVTKHKPDILFITSTPFSSFLLAPYLKKEFGLPVVLDYRDPWAANPGIEGNRLKARVALSFEKEAIAAADLVTTASYYMIDFIKKTLGSVTNGKHFFGLPYGYNGEFFRKEILSIPVNKSSEEVIATFAGADPNPLVHGEPSAETTLAGIKLAINKDKKVAEKLRFECYGTLFGCSTDPHAIINKYGLSQHVSLHSFLPYSEFLKVLRKSSFLLLPNGDSPIARVLYPTKFFDYLGVKRPILYIGGNGQVAESIVDCDAGLCSKPEKTAIAESLITILQEINVKTWYTRNSKYRELDRMNIFSDFCSKLNELC